jgi:threonine aldolase
MKVIEKPTEKMKMATFSAEVGDDVLGDDPTVKKLEKLSAEIFGKEAALFFPSGSMANATAVKVHNIPYGDGAFGVYIKGYTKAR